MKHEIEKSINYEFKDKDELIDDEAWDDII